MKKTSTLQQKLKSYSAVAGAVAASAAATDANAQNIVYTDVSPDATVNATTPSYDLDLNNDGTVDFVFGFYAGVYNYGTMQFPYNLTFVYTDSVTTNMVDTSAAAGNDWALVHNMNDPIGPTANEWNAQGGWLLGYAFTTIPYSGGNWLGQTDKYLAVQFEIGTNTHFGWVRLDHSADADSITIKDYAYEATPNTQILAGDMTVGVPSITNNSAKVFSFNKVINVNLGEVKDAVISVHDMTGREVSSVKLAGGSTQIDLTSAAEGIYTVSINTVEGRAVTKVAIK